MAGIWAKPAQSIRSALVALGAVAVFVGVSFGTAFAHQTGTKAPESIVVDGKSMDLTHGRFFVFFYDPECGHCQAAAKTMSKLKWKSDMTLIGIPTRQQQFAPDFLQDTGWNAHTSLEKRQNASGFFV